MRKVSLAWARPISVTPPCAWLIRPTRRRMKARITISPMSGSATTMRRKSARRYAQHAARLGGARRDQDLAFVEQIELAGELAVRQRDQHDRLVVEIGIVDLDTPG